MVTLCDRRHMKQEHLVALLNTIFHKRESRNVTQDKRETCAPYEDKPKQK